MIAARCPRDFGTSRPQLSIKATLPYRAFGRGFVPLFLTRFHRARSPVHGRKRGQSGRMVRIWGAARWLLPIRLSHRLPRLLRRSLLRGLSQRLVKLTISNRSDQRIDHRRQFVERWHCDGCLALVELDGLEPGSNEKGYRSIWNSAPPGQHALLLFDRRQPNVKNLYIAAVVFCGLIASSSSFDFTRAHHGTVRPSRSR
jgi:hypothetical protein